MADLAAARQSALMCMIDMGRDQVRAGYDQQQISISIRDGMGKVVYTARLCLVAERLHDPAGPG